MTETERKTFRISARFLVEIAVAPGRIDCVWDPDLPERLTSDEMDAYSEALEEMSLRLVKRTGVAVMCVEVKS